MYIPVREMGCLRCRHFYKNISPTVNGEVFSMHPDRCCIASSNPMGSLMGLGWGLESGYC
jgi:hypothetical protein